MEIVPGREWYLKGNRFDLKRITGAWDGKLRGALANGYDGMRASGNAFWQDTRHWKEFYDYESEINKWIKGKQMTALCTYLIVMSGAAEALEVARTDSLSPREREVLWWAAEGKSASEIGEILHITKRTVDEHTHNAARKLGAANRTQAVAIALRERLIGGNPP